MRYEPTEDELAAVEKDQRRRKVEAFKKALWSRQRNGEVTRQSAAEYATRELKKKVESLEDLTEDELKTLHASLGVKR